MAYTQASGSPRLSVYDDANTAGSPAYLNTMFRSVVPVFDLVSPRELPLMKAISGGDANNPGMNSLSEPCVSTKFEWMEDQDAPLVTAINTGTTMGDTTGTAMTVTAGHGIYFRVGDIVQVGTEQMRVTALTNADSVAVTRAWAATTPATHAASVAVTIIGRNHLEGSASPDDLSQLGSMPYNYTQEFAASFKLSDIEAAVKRYGITNAIEFETDRVTRGLMRRMERQCIFGKRVQPTASVPGAFGGLVQYVGTTNAVNGNLTKAVINTTLESVFSQVGAANMPDTFLCNAVTKRYLSTIYGTTNVTTFRDQSDPVGGLVIDLIRTDIAEIKTLLVNDMPDSILYAVKLDKLGLGPLKGQEMRRVQLAKTGTSEQFMIYGSYTFQMRASLAHAAWTGLSGVA